MIAMLSPPQITPEELLALPDDGKSYELVEGQLVEKIVSTESNWTSSKLLRFVGNHCDQAQLGEVWGGEQGYQCFPDDRVRKPDVSFVRRERITQDVMTSGWCPISPDLAVEVISPHELFYDVEAKVEEYLGAGVPLVWVLNPQQRHVRVFRSDRTITPLRNGDELSGENVIPGFKCKVSDLFWSTNI